MFHKKIFSEIWFIGIILLFSFQFFNEPPDFVYKKKPQDYIILIKKNSENSLISNELLKASYQLIKSLPPNFDKTGKTDYTSIIQNILDNNSIVTFPNFPLLINSNGLRIKSNSKIIFEKGSKLILQANAKTNYEILRIHNVNNVELFTPNLIGDRETHIGKTGEWGFGISIRGSQNISINNAIISNCWGDGIYIGSYGPNINSNIKIKDCFLDNNRRNGISIISGKDITISNSLISNTSGTAPGCGIDIEPNNNNEFLNNINLNNVITFNNENDGIVIGLGAFQGKENKNISITIKNHIDDNSGYAMGFALPKTNINNKKLFGNVGIINSVWKNSINNLVQFYDNNDTFINFNLKQIKIENSDPVFSNKKLIDLKNTLKSKIGFSISD